MLVTGAEGTRLSQQPRSNVPLQIKLIGGVVFNVAIYGGLLFLPAGTLDWWRAWVVVGVVFVGTVARTVSVLRVSKDLLEERFILVEEQFLKRELAGYDAYTERVRYRLIPFVW